MIMYNYKLINEFLNIYKYFLLTTSQKLIILKETEL